MRFEKLETSPRALWIHRTVEGLLNQVVRGGDDLLGRAHLGGRRANYDDSAYEFVGGPGKSLRTRHYDKSLRHLWKAEQHAPWLSFKDCSKAEQNLFDQALRSMTDEERAATQRLSMPEYRALLDREYTPRQKQAIVNILAAIGHGEAYAWLVSAELMGEVESTGARAALTMQVLEEAKHFVVLRELLRAFEVEIPRQSAWEYLFLEGVHKADGLEKFFGMNVAVEGIALSLFGMMAHFPGLEILRLFHLDESRHTALPTNYFREFPLSAWQKHSPVARARRLKMILPAIFLVFQLEEDLSELGIDPFEFGGSVLRKVTLLAERNGFYLIVPRRSLLWAVNQVFNSYCGLTRPDHEHQAFCQADTTIEERLREIESAVFAALGA